MPRGVAEFLHDHVNQTTVFAVELLHHKTVPTKTPSTCSTFLWRAENTCSAPQVTAAHPNEFIVMVVDGASSHVAKDLVVPENIRLLRLPAYSPRACVGRNSGKRIPEPSVFRLGRRYQSTRMWFATVGRRSGTSAQSHGLAVDN